LPKLDMAMP